MPLSISSSSRSVEVAQRSEADGDSTELSRLEHELDQAAILQQKAREYAAAINRIMPARASVIERCLRERILLTAAIFLLICLATALVYKSTRIGMQPDNHWAMKYGWQACAEIVLAGDSRIGKCLLPHCMSPTLGDRRIVNFFFPMARFTPQYLDGIEDVLDTKFGRPTIVLGITPHSFTLPAEPDNWFEDFRWMQPSPIELCLLDHLPYSTPMRLDTLLGMTNPPQFFSDGSGGEMTKSESRKEVPRYRGIFAERQVHQAVVDTLQERVRRWIAAGIKVYALRPPTCREMLEVESQSGFDESEFVRRFEDLGGIWIEVDQVRYHCIDGSHLHLDAAREFSRELARAIRQPESCR